MKYAFIIAVRNDQGQVLVLERPPTDTAQGVLPCFPGGHYEKSLDLRQAQTLQRQVHTATGLSIGGIHLVVTRPETDKTETHCYSAFINGGKLLEFPTRDYRGASWMTPSLALTLKGITPPMVDLLRKTLWIQG